VSALLLLLLGVGNVLFGYSKEAYYEQAIIEAQGDGIPSIESPGVQRMISRQRFYKIVYVGGYAFLAGALALLVFDESRRRRRR
jgi:hypothetical protein